MDNRESADSNVSREDQETRRDNPGEVRTEPRYFQRVPERTTTSTAIPALEIVDRDATITSSNDSRNSASLNRVAQPHTDRVSASTGASSIKSASADSTSDQKSPVEKAPSLSLEQFVGRTAQPVEKLIGVDSAKSALDNSPAEQLLFRSATRPLEKPHSPPQSDQKPDTADGSRANVPAESEERIKRFESSTGLYEFEYKGATDELSAVKMPDGSQIRQSRTGVIVEFDKNGQPTKALTDLNGSIKSSDAGYTVIDGNGKVVNATEIPGLSSSLEWHSQRLKETHKADLEKQGKIDDTSSKTDGIGRVEQLTSRQGTTNFTWDGNKAELAIVKLPDGRGLEKIDGMVFAVKDGKAMQKLTDVGGTIIPQADGVSVIDSSGRTITNLSLPAAEKNIGWKLQQLKLPLLRPLLRSR